MPMWASLAVSAGLGLWGAKKQSDSANKAADQQVQATDKGLALQEQIYGQQVAGMQPYAQFGQQALGSLGSLMGFPAPAAAAAPLPPQTSGTGVPWMPPGPANRSATPENGTGVLAVPRAGTLGAATQSSYRSPASGRTAPMQQTQDGGGSFSTGGQMVTLLAPTGETQAVPAEQAEMFIQRGARRVG